jgi:hypothetical protein
MIDCRLFSFEEVLRGFAVKIGQQNQFHDVQATVFLAGFKWLAIFSFPCLVLGAWLVVRKHPKMFQLWSLSLKQRSYYDPRK